MDFTRAIELQPVAAITQELDYLQRWLVASLCYLEFAVNSFIYVIDK